MLRLRVDPANPNIILAQRSSQVPDVFWGQLRVEWGYDGNPAEEIRVPLERFRSNLTWLKPACTRYGVSIDWTPEVLAVIAAIRSEAEALARARRGNTELTEEQVRERLAGSRFKRDLKPFQLRDIGILLGLAHGANFSVPGAGKTTVAYAVYEAERHAGRVDRLLVVAPLSAFDSWQTEAEECFALGSVPVVGTFSDSIPPGVEVLIINYHRLAANLDILSAWVRERRTLVLLDEAHRMKAGRAGQHGSACLDLAFAAARRDILTGTPSPQSTSDFVALYDYLWPGQARRILPPEALGFNPTREAFDRVHERTRPLFVRTTKAELELPAVSIRPLLVPLSGLQRAIYRALRDRYAGALAVSMRDRAELARMGTIMMYLLEAASNPQLLALGSRDVPGEFAHPPLPVEPGTRLWDLIAGYSRYETPPKFQRLAELIKNNVDHPGGPRKTLVWSNFVANLERLKRWLSDYQPAMIHGGVPSVTSAPTGPLTREMELDRFRNDPNCLVLLANPAAMSEGVSLHKTCHDAIYFERTFNAGQYLQSLDRIHRLGLEPDQETRVLLMMTADTIDEVVSQRLGEKIDRMSRELNDRRLVATALPDDEDYGPPIEDEDMEALLAHLRGENG